MGTGAFGRGLEMPLMLEQLVKDLPKISRPEIDYRMEMLTEAMEPIDINIFIDKRILFMKSLWLTNKLDGSGQNLTDLIILFYQVYSH